MLVLFATSTRMKKCCLYSALHEDRPSKHVRVVGFPGQAQNWQPIVGIINGLVCLNLKGNDLCLWNPALNKIKYLNVGREPPSGHDFRFSFGYGESNDDYKVVCCDTVRGDPGNVVHIYSLKAQSWRTIGQSKDFYLAKPNPGVFANGKIYWPVAGQIVSLDMSSEMFVEVQPPVFDTGLCLLQMGVSGGRPFVFCDYFEKKKADLWVLDKRGAEESWCKLVSIPNTYEIAKFGDRVICILSNDEILFGSGYGLFVYNWKKNESRRLKLGVSIASDWRVAAYVESLVWPDYA